MRNVLVLAVVLATATTWSAAACVTTNCADYNDPTCLPFAGDDSGVTVLPDGARVDAPGDATMIDVGETGGPDGPPPTEAGCPESGSPRDLPCRMNDATGLYVSATSGVDGGAGVGTRARPFATIGAAVAAIDAAHKNVYICAGTYPENVVINVDGVGMYGNFDCATWAADDSDAAAAQTKVAPTSGYALHVGAVHGAHFERVEFDGPDGKGPGESSIAVFVSGASGVEFRGVTMVAGVGRDGDGGADGVGWSSPAAQGHNAAGAMGGATQACGGCLTTSQSSGGAGGSGGAMAQIGGTGTPDLGGPIGMNGSGGSPGTPCTQGSDGFSAPPSQGGAGAARAGSVSDGGWNPTQGDGGATGGPGQGGGGGGGKAVPDAGGSGGGGCGGCGGGGGLPGQSGGSSFGLVVDESDVMVNGCAIRGEAAGNGGNGGRGQPGQSGGLNGGSLSGGCSGGSGGNGGQGGGGGGGAAGISAAIAYKGAAPSLTNGTSLTASSTPAMPGAPGAGGNPPATRGADPPDAGPMVALP